MIQKPAIPRRLANGDAETAALGLINYFEHADKYVSFYSSSRATRCTPNLKAPSLSSYQPKRYPHHVYWFEQHNHIDASCLFHLSLDTYKKHD